jgi:hypothetical protein
VYPGWAPELNRHLYEREKNTIIDHYNRLELPNMLGEGEDGMHIQGEGEDGDAGGSAPYEYQGAFLGYTA